MKYIISFLFCLLAAQTGCKSGSAHEEPEVTRDLAEASFSMRLDSVAACFGWHGDKQLAMFHDSLQWDVVSTGDNPDRPFEVEMTARVWAPVFSKVMGKARFAFDKQSRTGSSWTAGVTLPWTQAAAPSGACSRRATPAFSIPTAVPPGCGVWILSA